MTKPLLSPLICILLLLFSCSTNWEPEGISGLWKSRDQHSDRPRALVAIYKYQGEYYGRMLATYDEDGNIQDTILDMKEKAPGVVGNPPYCGMDFIYSVTKMDREDKYRGKILDPQKGKVYDAEFWLSGDDLIVRGKVWIFGKNILWLKASKQDLPKGFSLNKINDFVPVIPRT